MKHSNHLCYPSRHSPLRLTTKLCPHCRQHIDAAATRCQHCAADLRSWLARHPILTTLLIFFFFSIFLVIDGRSRTERVRRSYSWLRSCDAACAADLGNQRLHMINVHDCRELGGMLEAENDPTSTIFSTLPNLRQLWFRALRDKADSLRCP